MTDRCTGACCRDFTLPYSYEEMRRRWKHRLQLRLGIAPKEPPTNDKGFWMGTCEDDLKVFPLLIPLGKYVSTHYVDRGNTDRKGIDVHHYSCAKVLPNGDCGIYGKPERPDLCAVYPNGGKCAYKACMWTAGRVGTYPGGPNDPNPPPPQNKCVTKEDAVEQKEIDAMWAKWKAGPEQLVSIKLPSNKEAA
jgi:hypothetical protein